MAENNFGDEGIAKTAQSRLIFFYNLTTSVQTQIEKADRRVPSNTLPEREVAP